MFYYKTIEDEKGLWLAEDRYNREYILKTESVFAQCNGHFGVRASHEFDGITQKRGMFVSGLYQKADPEEVTELVNCPDICAVEVFADKEQLSMDTAELSEYSRKLNVHTGELRISCVLGLKNGHKIKMESRRFASFADLHLFCHEMSLTLLEGKETELTISYGINGQITNSGASHFHRTKCQVFNQKHMTYQGMLDDDGLELILSGELKSNIPAAKESFQLERRSIYKKQCMSLKEKETVSLFRVGYVREWSDISQQNQKERISLINQSVACGYDTLFSAHKRKMDKFWQMADIQIEGAALEERSALCFAQYHLYGMIPGYTDRFSAGAKGLTGEGYKGHVFWDTEIFLLPFFYYEFPKMAKKLLKYRYYGLEGAKVKAREYGYQGAMYPWEAAKNGYEETPLYAALNIHTGKGNKVWSGIKEHHVTADIVYAVMRYISITGDWEFAEKQGADIVFSAADFWVSRAVERNGRMEILDIIGPDEYNEHIDNNTYTNYMAKFTVEAAVFLEEKLRERIRQDALASQHTRHLSGSASLDTDWAKRVEKWNNFIQKIFLAKEGEDGIIPQDDTFLAKKELTDIEIYRKSQVKQSILLDYSRDEVVDMQVLKQADLVMLLNLFPGLFTSDTVKENVLYYEARTLHDSSLSYCAHAQACARIGEQKMAWDFFEKALEVDLADNPYDSTDGIHSASLGGIWNCVIQGFAGLSHDFGVLEINPHLPVHWNEMRFNFRYRGNKIQAVITKSSILLHARQAFDERVKLRVGEERYELEQDLEMKY